MICVDAAPENKVLVLGTALWGWGIDRQMAFSILDHFVDCGGRVLDTAANYPISGQDEDFGLATHWIAEWVRAHGATDLSVMVKIGAVDNKGGSSVNLGRSFIALSEEIFLGRLGEALAGLAIHWDDRNDERAVNETLQAFSELHDLDYSIGFSGVHHPALYLQGAPDLADAWWVQVKENAGTAQARKNYQSYFPKARYLAYGINMGGVKLEGAREDSSISLRGIKPEQDLVDRLVTFIDADHGLEPRPVTMNELALTMAWHNEALSGIVLGPRNVEQLRGTLSFWRRLQMDAMPAMAATLPYPT